MAHEMLFDLFLTIGLLSSSPGIVMPAEDSLHAVTVTADRGVVVSRTDTLSLTDKFFISDLLHQSPSLYIGDNGGLAGLKTVSLRGMGSAHTSIYVDGVRVGNVQSGQNDLGMLGMENFASAVVDYAQNSLSFNTIRPEFGKHPVSVRAGFLTGSFGTYMPTLRTDFRLSRQISLSANVAGVLSKGYFPYADNSIRLNNDLKQVRAGLDLFGIVNRGDFHVKAYMNSSDRGTPGSVQWPSDDRQNDMNIFLQGVFRKSFSSLYKMNISAKAAYDDIAYSSQWGDSRYAQTEFQLNSSHNFRIRKWWNLSLAADLCWNGLNSTEYEASRLSVLAAMASSFRTKKLTADLTLEYSGAFDMGAASRSSLSPALNLRFNAFDGFDLVAFARRAYRVPNFNELYYVGYGNPELAPEDAYLTDVGMVYNKSISESWALKAQVDAFYNILNNKIISSPSEEDPNIWRPYNIGRVRSVGTDAVAGVEWKRGAWSCGSDIRYSWQSAVDVTPDSYAYGQSVPYVAKHTVVLSACVQWKGFMLSPQWHLRAGRSDGYGRLPDWDALDLTISKSFVMGQSGVLSCRLSVRNVYDSRYELVSGYPMPGRNVIGGLEYRF